MCFERDAALSWLRPFQNEDLRGLLAAASLPGLFLLGVGYAHLPAVSPLFPAVVALSTSCRSVLLTLIFWSMW